MEIHADPGEREERSGYWTELIVSFSAIIAVVSRTPVFIKNIYRGALLVASLDFVRNLLSLAGC